MKFSNILFALLLLFSCKKEKLSLTKITANTIAIDSTIISSLNIDSIIAPYNNTLTAEMEKVLTFTSKDLVRFDGEMQSTLGNLMADLCYEIANPIFKEKTNQNIDFAMFNYGGIRAGIPKGEVTTENAFNLMPFENELVVAEIKGEKVIELVNYFIKGKRAHPLSKHIRLIVEREDYQLNINGIPFDKDKIYSVLTSDYLQNGGDRMNFFANPKKLTKLDVKVRDAILTYFEKVDELNPVIDNRVILK